MADARGDQTSAAAISPSGERPKMPSGRNSYAEGSRTTSNGIGPSTTRPPRLSRQTTNNSIHAQNSLRRMATHETGHGIDHDHDGADDGRMAPHDEDHELDGRTSRDHSGGSSAAILGQVNLDEESRIGAEEVPEKNTELETETKKKAPELQDQTNLLPVKQVILVFVGLTCALFCSLIDQTIITTALPTLGRVFNRADISPWVGTAYLLTSTAMQPIYGRLSDIFGRKVVLLASLGVFWIGSLACALAQSMIQLIVFRAIQGIGGGGVLTLAMIIISDVVSLKERGKYQGITGVVVVLSNSLGPIIGGLLTERASWRWCFYINLPMTAISIVLVFFLLPLRRVKGSVVTKIRQIDFLGSALTLAWAVLVLLALSWGGNQYGWDSAAVLAPLFIGLALLAVFIYIEIKVIPLPLIPFYILRNMTVSACMLTTFANGAAFYGTLYYLPTYFQVVRGASAIRSGVLLLPLVIVQTLCAFVAGIVVSKTGDYWWNMVAGFSIWTIGLGLMSTIDANTSEAKLAGYQVLIGIGAGQTFQTSLIAIQASVERKDMATATGLRNFLRMLGGTVALTVCSTIINNIVSSSLRSAGFSSELLRNVLNDPTMLSSQLSIEQRNTVLQAYSDGINACFYFFVPLIGISVFLTIFGVKKVSLKRSDDADKKAEAKIWVEERKRKRAEKHGKHEHQTEPEPKVTNTKSRPPSETDVVPKDHR